MRFHSLPSGRARPIPFPLFPVKATAIQPRGDEPDGSPGVVVFGGFRVVIGVIVNCVGDIVFSADLSICVGVYIGMEYVGDTGMET